MIDKNFNISFPEKKDVFKKDCALKETTEYLGF